MLPEKAATLLHYSQSLTPLLKVLFVSPHKNYVVAHLRQPCGNCFTNPFSCSCYNSSFTFTHILELNPKDRNRNREKTAICVF